MTGKEKLAFRILASLYPDRKPSEIRRIIDDALAKEPNNDDVELWAILTREKVNDKEDTVKERIIEHHYHDRWYGPYWYNYASDKITLNNPVITCEDNNTIAFADCNCNGETRLTMSI